MARSLEYTKTRVLNALKHRAMGRAMIKIILNLQYCLLKFQAINDDFRAKLNFHIFKYYTGICT